MYAMQRTFLESCYALESNTEVIGIQKACGIVEKLYVL